MAKDKCWCSFCDEVEFVDLATTPRRMNLCPVCGNKRCPRATWHINACTGSNDPGQLGSRYR